MEFYYKIYNKILDFFGFEFYYIYFYINIDNILLYIKNILLRFFLI